MKKTICLMMLLSCCLVACTSDKGNYAPVYDVSTIEHIPKSGAYRVMSGETLYSIAWRYGLDYRYLANRNHIRSPYHVVTGQMIYLRGKPEPMTVASPVVTPAATSVTVATTEAPSKASTRPSSVRRSSASMQQVVNREPNAPVKMWRWPTRGPVIRMFSSLNKGINIGGKAGQPVKTTAPGQVVYSGDGLRGYGNLIIIKHNSKFLTAYAHVRDVLVKEGDWVAGGQQVAEMGDSGSRRVMLHFEIRRDGQPVNPLNYLAQR